MQPKMFCWQAYFISLSFPFGKYIFICFGYYYVAVEGVWVCECWMQMHSGEYSRKLMFISRNALSYYMIEAKTATDSTLTITQV